MQKLDHIKKQNLVAGAFKKKLHGFGKIMAFGMLGESINGILSLINQGIYYAKTKHFINTPNHFNNPSSKMYFKFAPYPTSGHISFGSPWI